MDEKIESRVVKNGSIIKVGVAQIDKEKIKENKKERAYLKKSDAM